MKGKVCLVTGGASGVGRAIAAGCARLGATVVLVTRDRGRGEAAAAELRAETGNGEIEWLGADLSDMDSVRALALAFRSRYSRLDLLSNNAAILSFDRRLTAAGQELTFATNYLGHFLLALLLRDLLEASAPSRVITVSGHPATMTGQRLDFDDLMLEKGYGPIKATARAGLAKVLFSHELSRRLGDRGVSSNTFHPGFVRSKLVSGLPWYLRLPGRFAMSFLGESCDTGVYLASSPEVEGTTGAFFVGRKRVAFEPGWDLAAEGARLWEASLRLVGQGEGLGSGGTGQWGIPQRPIPPRAPGSA